MKELFILLAPVYWSVKNDIVRFNLSFYKKSFFYTIFATLFILLFTRLLNMGMVKLQSMPSDIFDFILIKGYTLLFIIIFFIQLLNGFIISLNTYYQSRDMELLVTSPVNRTALFLSRLLGTYIKTSWMLIIFGIPLLVSCGLLYKAGIVYYFGSILLFIAFSGIPVNMGIITALIIAGLFNIGKLKKVLLSAGLFAVALIVLLVRVFEPERFVNPQLFANATLFLSETKAPAFVLLPNRWISEALFSLVTNKVNSDAYIFIALLFLTVYITGVFAHIIFKKFHNRGWKLLQEGEGSAEERKKTFLHKLANKVSVTGFFIKFVSLLFNTETAMLIKKEFAYQTRDSKNVNQLLILLTLIVVYLFSIAALPLNWNDIAQAVRLKHFVSLFNLGIVLIILSSICSRVIYPIILYEGPGLWAIKTSPVSSIRYILTKSFFFFIPLFFLGQTLTIVSSYFINIERELIVIKSATTGVMSLSLVSMAILFGISNLRQTLKSESDKGEAKSGNTMYMLLSVLLISLTLLAEFIGIFYYFLNEPVLLTLTQSPKQILFGAIALIAVLNIFITVVSTMMSIRKFRRLEFS